MSHDPIILVITEDDGTVNSIEVSMTKARHSIMIRNMLEDLKDQSHLSESTTDREPTRIPLPICSYRHLHAVLQLIGFLESQPDSLSITDSLIITKITSYLKSIAKSCMTDFFAVLKLINYLDIPQLLDLGIDVAIGLDIQCIPFTSIQCDLISKRLLQHYIGKLLWGREDGLSTTATIPGIPTIPPVFAVTIYKITRTICVTPDNKIIFGTHDGHIGVYDITNNKYNLWYAHSACVRYIAGTSDNKIISDTHDGKIHVWDVEGNELIRDSSFFNWGRIGRIVTASNDRILTEHGSLARLWDTEGNRLAVYELDPERGKHSFLLGCITADKLVCTIDIDGHPVIWDFHGNQLAVCQYDPKPDGIIYKLYVTPDNRIIVINDEILVIWNMRGELLGTCTGHTALVTTVCSTIDNKIVSGSDDHTIRIWDSTGTQLAICVGHSNWVTSVCATKDNKIVSCSRDCTVRIWDTNGNIIAVCEGHKDWVTFVHATDENKIVSYGHDGTIRIWNFRLVQLLNRNTFTTKQCNEIWNCIVRYYAEVSRNADYYSPELLFVNDIETILLKQ